MAGLNSPVDVESRGGSMCYMRRKFPYRPYGAVWLVSARHGIQNANRIKEFLKHEAFHGNEIVANTRRLCLMNMFLHNIGEIDGTDGPRQDQPQCLLAQGQEPGRFG